VNFIYRNIISEDLNLKVLIHIFLSHIKITFTFSEFHIIFNDIKSLILNPQSMVSKYQGKTKENFIYRDINSENVNLKYLPNDTSNDKSDS